MKNDITATKTTFKNLVVRKAYTYYLKGLNAAEIGLLLNVSARTIQRYTKEHRFKDFANPLTLEQKADELRKRGLTYKQIGKAIGKGRTTVYYYLRKCKTNTP
jgi:transposase